MDRDLLADVVLALVGDAVLDIALELTTGNVNRVRNCSLLVLVGLADVEQDVALVEECGAAVDTPEDLERVRALLSTPAREV